MEQVKKVISQAQVHKPSKIFMKRRLLSDVICEAFRSIIMAYLLVACKTGQACLACTLPSSEPHVLFCRLIVRVREEGRVRSSHDIKVVFCTISGGWVGWVFPVLLGKDCFQLVCLINFFNQLQTRLQHLKETCARTIPRSCHVGTINSWKIFLFFYCVNPNRLRLKCVISIKHDLRGMDI